MSVWARKSQKVMVLLFKKLILFFDCRMKVFLSNFCLFPDFFLLLLSIECCIYHKPRPWDESSSGSSDESNKSDNEAESEADANSLTK